MKTVLLSLVLAVAGACTGSSSEDELTFETDGGKADAVRPYGRFERTPVQGENRISRLQLNEDRTYQVSEVLPNCATCPDSFSDTYKFASSRGNPYVVLYDEGNLWYSFEYKLSADSLSLRETGTDSWFTMNEVAAGLELDDSDNNGSFDVPEGDDVIVKLGANATTGYSWVVTAVDKSFGYPEEDYVVDGPATGSGGTSIFTWKTKGTFPLVGSHSVTLEYRRPWDTTSPAEKTFKFTVNVTAP